MAQKDGTIIIDTRINTNGFNTGAVNMQSQFSKLAGAAKKLGLAIGGIFAVGKLVQFGKEAIQLGSDLQEVQNVVDVTFGSLNGTINEFAKNAITQFGLSELSAKQYASTIGAMLKSMGLATDQAAAMSMEITGLAGDMASFYNLSGDEAFAKIRAGISGETEPLKQLGINLSVANLEQYALAQGITKTYNAMTEQEKALLRYNYLLSVTSDAQGDFARTSNSWANQTKVLSMQFASLKATIGQGLINVLTPVLAIINTILSGLQAVANAFRQFTALLFGDAGGMASQAESVADGYESAAGAAEDLAGATEKAGKAAKKYLAGFDEITKVTEKSGSGGSGGGVSGIGGVDFGGINLGGGEPVEDTISPQIQAIVDKCLQLIAPLKEIDFGPLKQSLAELGGVFGELGVRIVEGLEWAWFNILVPLSQWTIEEALPGLLGLLADALQLLSEVLGPVGDGFNRLWKYLAPVFEFIGGAASKILEGFMQIFEEVAKIFEERGADIAEVFENIGIIIGAVWSVIQPILADWVELFAETFELISYIVGDAVSFIIDILHGISEFLGGIFTGDWERAWGGIVEVFKGAGGLLLVAMETVFGGIAEIWGLITSTIKGAINGIIAAINGLLRGIASGINGIAKTLNKFSVKIPDWVPEWGGKYFGFNLKTNHVAPQIPYLAKGAVIPPNAPFLAVLGDQHGGTNIEAPLSTIEEAVERVMRRNSSMADERIIVLLSQILEAVMGIEIDGETLSRAIDNYRRKEAVSRG